MISPENVRRREEAAARCTAKIKRKVVKTQARKARAEHLVTCCSEPGKKKAKRKPLTELYVKGHFTEDTEKNGERNFRGIVQKCTLIRKKQKKYKKAELNIFKKKGNQQFTEDGRNAEITVDLVLQARAKLSDNKVIGPEDAIV